MPYSLPEKQIELLVTWIGGYITEQRSSFQPKATPIVAEHKKALRAFFPEDLLDKVCVARGRAPEPSFYPQLRELGIHNAPAFSDMAGITFQDVVVHVEKLTLPLLFHELVHAVQYKHLGLQGFANAYVRGFLKGGSYEAIPLEEQAYALDGRFSANPAATFSVEGDVIRRIRAKRF